MVELDQACGDRQTLSITNMANFANYSIKEFASANTRWLPGTDQWRICFVWQDGDAHDVEFVTTIKSPAS